ncbi:MAG: MBL fold metallo-hydrolase [Woeseiaceae bacterium]|nr:MBL fold metallo-hydrolase [Woeseiaceae bacterium]
MKAPWPSLPAYAELADGVARVLAPNASMMTGPGTNTYLFGRRQVAVVDPGPASPEHIDNIIDRAPGPIRWVLVTHTHPDHSPGAEPLASRTGAELLGRPAPAGPHQDATFRPTRVLEDGDVLETDEFRLEVIHTPGHASNHVCYQHAATNWIVTGDHVIDGSTVVIDPPDGNMAEYLDALAKVRDRRPAALLPGHGERIDAPREVIDWIIEHRLAREAKVLAALGNHPARTTHELVPHVYQDAPEHLHGLAERSLLAHLVKLEAEGRAASSDGRWYASGNEA